jgi:hypothetical protein
MAQPGFIIEKRYNFPRVPWEVQAPPLRHSRFSNLTNATEVAAKWKASQPDYRFRILYQSGTGSEFVVVPPEAFDFNLQVEAMRAQQIKNVTEDVTGS